MKRRKFLKSITAVRKRQPVMEPPCSLMLSGARSRRYLLPGQTDVNGGMIAGMIAGTTDAKIGLIAACRIV